MTPAEKRSFLQAEITSLEAPIWKNTILQKAYAAGGESTKAAMEQTATVLGGLIAAKESLESDLAAIPE